MHLIYDDCDGVYVWVEDFDENISVSPHFDYEDDANDWYIRMKAEFLKPKNK